ncbi:DUF2332 domain-containing protein [Piscinibacter gummiphilus]|uniref:DUF2332 domain-containing protein n=1 Tax=Piscinibacter gummiphilus TaxID=946333 RepID=A0ABZ0CT76_9BURK|nr:DUF2332 domain-containing protein [Piscinibacter gummiphilus]WOB08179.1 DUF2332 domain-containing protein [Piscinibacter gummiphilus]
MDLTPADTGRLAALFRHFANVECPEEPLYEALCRIVADDPALLGLLSGASPEQQRPNLWLAAVHDSLLSGVTHPLAAYYPSCGGDRAPDAALASCVREFAAQHAAALRELMRTRSTQTNEIGRCAVLWPALHALAARSGRAELALLDVGTSAGLNLGVDVYRYDAADARPGVPLLSCEWQGERRAPTTPTPKLVQRLGLDPAPVTVDDERAVRWLRACLWPSDTARATRFEQAVQMARARRWPVRREADCTAAVEPWVASLPSGVRPVIFNSWVLTYFERPALQRHIETVTELVRRTGAMWLSAESSALRVGPVELPPPRPDLPKAHSVWTLCHRVGGELRFEALARSHAHGRWAEWVGA